jgi:ankyrin repeat protein
MKAKTLVLSTLMLFSALSALWAQDIFDAIKNNDVDIVKSLIENNISLVNQTDNTGNTPLHNAVLVSSKPIIGILLSKGADIDAGNTQKSTPLQLAIANKNDEIAKYLIDKGANINKQDLRGNTPLHYTVYSNSNDIAQLLIDKGADIEAKSFNNYTPLSALTRSTRNFEVAKVLVKNGADVNVPWTDGDRPLNYAAMYSDGRVIDLLMDHNADIDTTGEHLSFTLTSTVRKGHVRLFNFIVEKCGDKLFDNAEMNKNLIRNAITSNSIEIVKILQTKKIPLDLSPSITGATPLHSIASNPEAIDMAEFLVKKGIDINARTNDGRTAYNIAEANGNKKMQELLVSLGAKTDPQKFPVITGPYLGQTPPDTIPKQFAPGIVYASHSTVSVSPDGKEMYWGNGYSILYSKIQDGQWTKPDYVPFSGENERMFYDDVPFVSPDNKRLFFTSQRPVDSLSKNSRKENIWFVERTANGWSVPKPVSPEVNALGLHWQVSVSNSGKLYFSGVDQTSLGNSDIYFSRLVNGEYTKPVNAGSVINSAEGESMPFIAPDESYLIFYRIVMQRPYLYISFKSKDGNWIEPEKVNLPAYNCGIVSPDGKYFFMDNRWVSADFIDIQRPD